MRSVLEKQMVRRTNRLIRVPSIIVAEAKDVQGRRPLREELPVVDAVIEA
jgi:hypothetical protein